MLYILFISLLLLAFVEADVPLPSSCNGYPNRHPYWTDKPKFVAKHQHGLKYIAAPPNITAPTTVLHVYGTPYQMGLAYGSLMFDEINDVLPQVEGYMKKKIASVIEDLPEDIREAILEHGINWALEFTYNVTLPYTPPHFLQLMRGVADGAGLPYMDIVRVAMIPELIKASCSIMGAWGEATANTPSSRSLVQLRALDWSVDGPFQDYPILITYHPEEGNGNAFTALSWAGLVGTLTGWSSSGISLSQKLWASYDGLQNIMGKPFHFLIQDILQYDTDVDQAISSMAEARRTCAVYLGVGDGNRNEFKIVAYSHDYFHIWNEFNFPTSPNHDLHENLLFIDRRSQPTRSSCFNDMAHMYHGELSADRILRYVTPGDETGNAHIALYDHGPKHMYISNASPYRNGTAIIPAYSRRYMRFDMEALWSQRLDTP